MRRRAYSEPYWFRAYKIEDEYDNSPVDFYLKSMEGPVFPNFLEADFSSYEGFRKFTNLYGIAGFTLFHQGGYPLKDELKKIEEKPRPIARSYIEGVWRKIKGEVIKKQTLMGVFAHRFLKNFPLKTEKTIELNKKVEDWKLIMNANEYLKEFGCRIFISVIHWKHRDFRKESVNEQYEYPSIISRCYHELIHLIQDGVGLKRCDNCGIFFVSDKSNEIYCDRIAPQKTYEFNKLWKQFRESHKEEIEKYGEPEPNEWDEILSVEEKRKIDNLTCKKFGRFEKWKKSLTQEEAFFQAEKKRKQAKLYYLRDKVKEGKASEKEYQKALADYEHWRKENEPRKEGE